MLTPNKIGKYEIQGQLGTGGMGVVYKGWDASIARGVAIKSVDKTSLAGDELVNALSRFRQEAQAVGRLVHPRIVQIYDYIEDEQGAYIVMELVNGKTLSNSMTTGAHYDIAEVGRIVLQILDGIGYAHEQGVVHRDLKPSNILINQDGRIKINDFGIAHIEASELTKVGEVLGTPQYMSPEQFLGTSVERPSDLFAVAVMAYELLTGCKPFNGTFASVMYQVLNIAPPTVSSLNPLLLTSVDNVIQKALAKKSSDRYQTAGEFAAEFKMAIAETLGHSLSSGLSAVSSMVSNGTVSTPADAMLSLSAAKILSQETPLETMSARDSSLRSETNSAISLDTSIRKARLLIVDDEERILNALRSMFRQRYHVFCTTDGNKALAFMAKYQMHVIISDQRMPEMLGVELLRRSREICPNSVRILLTGYSDLAAIVGSINDGEIYRFISKPWDNKALQTIVAEAVTIGLELANTKNTAVALPTRMSAGVLVVDPDEDVFRVVRELISGLCPVLYAATQEDALQVMHQQEIAVVIADVAAGGDAVSTLLKLLKQENPEILSIVLSKTADSELVIELINQAQVFRILSKPLNLSLLKTHLHAALQRYLQFQHTPQLVLNQRVETVETMRESGVGQRILASLKSFRARWLGAN